MTDEEKKLLEEAEAEAAAPLADAEAEAGNSTPGETPMDPNLGIPPGYTRNQARAALRSGDPAYQSAVKDQMAAKERSQLMDPGIPLDPNYSKHLAFDAGGTYNLAGRILAAKDAVVDTAKSDTSKEGLIAHLKKKYDEQLPLYQRMQKKAEAENPLATIAGGVVGPGPKAAKTGVGRIATSSALGAGMGAAGAEEDDVLKDMVMGGGVGLLTGGTAEVVGSKVIPWLKGKAETLAYKAMQGSPGINDIARRMGYETEPEIRQLGREALDQGLIPAIGKPSEIADRAGKLKQQAFQSQQAVLQQAERSATPFDYTQALGDAEKSMRTPALTAAGEDSAGAAKGVLDQIARQDALTPGSYLGANKLLSDAYDAINWDTEAALSQRLAKKTTLGLRDSIENQVGQSLGFDKADDLAAANKAYGTAADVYQLANRAARRDMGHTLNFGQLLLGMGAGASAGAMTRGGAGAAGFGALGALPAAANYATKAYQPAALSRLADFAIGPTGALATQAPAIGRGVLAANNPVSDGQASQGALEKLKAYFGGDVPPEEAPKADFVKAQTDPDYRKQR